MKHLHKALALLLCLAVCLTLMPAAFAEEPTGDYLVWEDEPAANETRPIITAQPASISVTEGATASFTVKASGTNLKYQWQVLAANTTVWLNAASTTATLKFTATTDQNSYAYRCIVSNGGGSVTSELALLSVTAGSPTVTKPSITTQPKSVTVPDGTQTTFSVRASGSGLKYQWQYRTSSSGSWTNSSAASGTTRDFVVNARTAINGYQYRCKVSNTGGTVYTSVVTLTVSSSTTAKPVITTQPVNFSAAAGTQTTVSVTATGSNLQYQWQYRTSSSGAWKNSVAASGTTKTLTVNARTELNGYQYRCKVSNSAGYVYSNVATLTVTNITKPTITTQPKSVTAADGTQTTFTVKASGSGLKYQWQYRTSSSGSWTNSVAASGTTKTLTVNARTALNGYQYRCKVSNAAGTVYSSVVTLTVVAKPSITTQPKSVTVADGTTATFSVRASGSNLKYKWQYRTSSSGSWTNCVADSSTTNTLSVNARTALNGYQYRCKVSNVAGYVYTSVVTLTVKDSQVRRALLIGNNAYSGDPLPASIQNTTMLKGVLTSLSNKFTCTVRTDRTTAEMRSDITEAFKGATENDVSLLYFAGHGVQVVNSPAEAVKYYQGAITGIEGGNVPIPELAQMLSQVPGRVIVILDSCHSGAAISSNGGEDPLDAFNQSVIDAFAAYDTKLVSDDLSANAGELAQSKFIVFTATKFSETGIQVTRTWSSGDQEFYGIFTRAFVEGCGGSYPSGSYVGYMPADTNGDSKLTVSEIHNYAHNQTLSEGAQLNHTQNTMCYAANMSEILFKR